MKSFMNRLTRVLVAIAAIGCMPAVAQKITYFHNDAAGTPIVASNEQGQVVWRESYRPYGERLTKSAASASNDIFFTSRRQDSTGLTYMGARYYDPVVGRFMSMDPVGFVESNLHSHNRYAYGNNNPLKYYDPTGGSSSLIGRAVLGVLVGMGAAGAPMSQEERERRVRATQDAVRGLFGLIFNENSESAGNESEGGQREGTSGGTRAGKPFTPKGKAEIDAENADRNGGVNKCENCGETVVPGQQSQKGVSPPGNERQRDHIVPRSKGGDGSPSNGQVLCRDCNRAKSDN